MMQALLYRLGYPSGAGISVWLVNVLFQRVLRLDAGCRYSKSFTSRVLHPSGLEIEDDDLKVRVSLAVSGGCYINCADGLFIGRGTIWAPNVSIVSQTHDIADFDRAPATQGIHIGRDCWIGAGAVILPGVHLGPRTIVGANSVVRQSFPSGHVVIAGAPAAIVRHL
jgi:acetyltransferase-like isoleucine patch superfamily enzyme